MIFLSHTHSDKALVDEIAGRLAKTFGKEAIFYDSWSIQPGDGIIDKMNAGLANCSFFFFFVSKKSLQSNMVKLEWQNALLKATKGETKVIPVKVDDVLMPAVLLQTLYVDVFGEGLETAVRQMVDVVSGQNTYKPKNEHGFQNVRAYVTGNSQKLSIELRAEAYMEPHSRYLILLDNTEAELGWNAVGEGQYESGFNSGVTLNNGTVVNALLIARHSPTSPGFPFVVELTAKAAAQIKIRGVMRIVARDQFAAIPVIG
jgi:hypothetical protein